MTPTLSGFVPPDSISHLVEMAIQRRRGLLASYLLSLPIVIPLLSFGVMLDFASYRIDSARDIDSQEFLALLLSLGILLFIQLIALYGGGAVGPPSVRWASRLRTLRDGPWLGWLLRRPGLVVVLRWFLPFSGFVVQMSIVLSVLGMAILDITERRVGVLATDRALVDTAFLSGMMEAAICFLGSLPVSLVIAGVCVVRTTRFKAMSRLVMISWTLSLYAGVLSSVLLGVHVAVVRQAPVFFDTSLLVIAWTAFLVNSCAALRLLYLQAREPDVSPSSPAACGHMPVKGHVNLSSARVFAVVLLAVGYMAVNVAVEQAEQMGRLQGARQMFAAHYIADHREQNSDRPNVDLPHYLGNPTIRNTSLSFIVGSITIVGVDVVQIDGERWTAVAPRPHLVERQVAMTRLLAIASRSGIDASRNESFYQLFGQVQQKLLASQKQVSVPVVGLQLEARNAAWALAGLTLVLLLLIRSRVRRVFLDPDLAIEQPWLVLDWQTGIEHVAAVTWLLLVLLGPWVANATLAVTLAVQISAEGAITSVPGDVLRISFMLSLFVLSAWTALLTVSDVHCLRTLRFRHLEVNAPLTQRADAREDNDVERG